MATVPSARTSGTASATNSGATVTLTIPVGVVAGDLMIAVFGGGGTTAGTCTPPSGWLRLPRFGGHGGILSGNGYAYYKYAVSADTGGAATAVWTFANSVTIRGNLATFQDVDPNVPFSNARHSGGGTDDYSVTGIYPGIADSLGILVEAGNGGIDESTIAFTGGDAANWSTVVASQESGGNGYSGISKNVTSFASASFASSKGGTTRVIFASSTGFAVMLSLNPVLTVATVLDRSTGQNGASGVTNMDIDSGYTSSGGGPSYAKVPGVLCVAQWAFSSETADMTGATFSVNGGAFTAVDSAPYDQTGTDTGSVKAYKMAVTEAECWNASGVELIRGVNDTSVNFSAIAYWIMPLAGTSVVNIAHNSDTANTTTPNGPSAVCVTAGSVAINLAVCTGATNTTATAPTGYTFGAYAKNSNQSLMHTYSAYKVGLTNPSEDPGAWASADNDQYINTTISIGVVATLAIAQTAAGPKQQNVAYDVTLTATGGVAPVTFAVQSGTVPTGLTLETTGQLHGTPSATGTFNYTVRATDAVGTTADQAFAFVVYGALDIVETTAGPKQKNTAYDVTLTKTGGYSTVTYAVQSGSLPTGLTLETTGRLHGTPSASGTFNYTVRATDSDSNTDDQAFAFVVYEALDITTTSLPGTVANSAGYSQQLAKTGGYSTVTWDVSAGSLPTGLSMSTGGLITGTPTVAGNFSFTARATDSDSNTDTQALSIAVVAESKGRLLLGVG